MDINPLLINTWVKEILREILNNFEPNGNVNKISNICDVAKAILRGKFIAMNAYIRKGEKSKISNLSLHLNDIVKKSTLNTK